VCMYIYLSIYLSIYICISHALRSVRPHKFEQALGVGDGRGSLVCCSPWGHKESDMTEQLN